MTVVDIYKNKKNASLQVRAITNTQRSSGSLQSSSSLSYMPSSIFLAALMRFRQTQNTLEQHSERPRASSSKLRARKSITALVPASTTCGGGATRLGLSCRDRRRRLRNDPIALGTRCTVQRVGWCQPRRRVRTCVGAGAAHG